MMRGAMVLTTILFLTLVLAPYASRAQFRPMPNPDAERAQQSYRLAWEYLESERWEDAAREFQHVISIDRKHKLAYYGLGRADMALKKFTDAAKAYETCRGLYEAQASDNFRNSQEADRMRQNDLEQLQIAISSLTARSGAQGQRGSTQLQISQLRAQMQRIQLRRDADRSFSLTSEAPAFVSLALGSAYFRSGRLGEAEREYKATIAADSKAGEAYNNLAVVYLETGRIEEAEKAVNTAEKTGFKVNPMLKDDIAIAKTKSRQN
jgi:tetratricopeptide (TPR) repeat protein